MSNNNVPKLRFPGFEGEWEEKKLGEICDVTDYVASGSFATIRENVQYRNHKDFAILVRIADYTNGFDESKFVYVDKHAYDFLSKSSLKEGNIVMSNVGSCGLTFRCPNLGQPMTLAPNAIVIRTKNDDFYYQLFVSHMGQKSIRSLVAQGAMPKFNKTEFKELAILVPTTLPEQQKIASCLTEMDNLIASQGQKVEALKEKKKGLMQQLFPQPGETSPQLRFPGFTGEWEEKKLGEIGDTYGGLSGKSKDDFDDGNSKFITFMNVLNNVIINTEILGSVKIKENEHQNKVRFGDMLFNTSSETPEEVGFCAVFLSNLDNVYLNSFCFGYRFNSINDYLPLFLAYYFRSDCGRELMHRLAQGITRFNLSKSHFNKASIAFPPLPEQQKIALCLSSLDDLIAAESEKLEALKSHKKGLMQQLFPQPEK